MPGAGGRAVSTSALKAPAEAVSGGASGLQSAVYEGILCHRRFGPGPVREFSYRVAVPLLYLDEIDAVTRLHPLWSSRRPAPVWFRRGDYLGEGVAKPLDQAVRDVVEERLQFRPVGPVAMLANVRTWGWLFNPISMYFCTGADGHAVEALVAEVENTPWHERHCYAVGPPGRHRFAKVMHVSPFLPMDVEYQLSYTTPADRLLVRLGVLRGDQRLFAVTLSLRRRALSRQALSQLLWHNPAPTLRVSTGIYAQAIRLGLCRAPFYPHPARRALGA